MSPHSSRLWRSSPPRRARARSALAASESHIDLIGDDTAAIRELAQFGAQQALLARAQRPKISPKEWALAMDGGVGGVFGYHGACCASLADIGVAERVAPGARVDAERAGNLAEALRDDIANIHHVFWLAGRHIVGLLYGQQNIIWKFLIVVGCCFSIAGFTRRSKFHFICVFGYK